jgi:5-methyltetrahydropteroyltriglutamate--homocysteine methyltransferase
VKLSSDRILTTHSGSLIRPRELVEAFKDQSLNQPIRQDELDTLIGDSIAQVVRQQVAAGIDVPNDGESRAESCTGTSTTTPLTRASCLELD